MSAQVLDRSTTGEIAPDSVRGRGVGGRHIRFDRRLALVALGLIAAGGVAWYGWDWWRVGRFIETTDDAYVGGNVTTLSPHVAGFVSKILVGDNQFVHSGQLVIELDDRDYLANLAHAEAVVRNQSAALINLHAKYALQQSMIQKAEADLLAKEADAGYAREDAARYHKLALTTFGTVQNDQKAFAADQRAEATVRAGAAGLAAARQQLAVIDTEIAETEASQAQAQADLRTAQLDLGYTRIRAPIDGYIGDRAAQIGAYATVGTALLSIVPAQGLWVDANFKEDELARMRPGQRASHCRRRAARPYLRGPGAEPRPGDRRRLQRHSAGKRDWQFHQDRAARPGPHRRRRRGGNLGPFASRPIDDGQRRHALIGGEPPMSAPEKATAPSIIPFAVMCVGMFVALLDIQIVASSLQDIGGGLSAAQDQISWVQTAYLIAEIIVIPRQRLVDPGVFDALAVRRLGRRVHPRQPPMRNRLEY